MIWTELDPWNETRRQFQHSMVHSIDYNSYSSSERMFSAELSVELAVCGEFYDCLLVRDTSYHQPYQTNEEMHRTHRDDDRYRQTRRISSSACPWCPNDPTYSMRTDHYSSHRSMTGFQDWAEWCTWYLSVLLNRYLDGRSNWNSRQSQEQVEQSSKHQQWHTSNQRSFRRYRQDAYHHSQPRRRHVIDSTSSLPMKSE